MINFLDELLRDLLVAQVTNLVADQVRFEPPTKSWFNNLTPPSRVALNIYLADLRENRKLRSNDRMRVSDKGVYIEEQAPARLDCHYLITAWSSTTPGPGAEPALAEHLLLHQVATVMMRHALVPSALYPRAPGSPLENWPERFRDHELPLSVAPVEGFSRIGEFWHSMGADVPWKPTLYLVVTVPIELLREVTGPMVTTRITTYSPVGATTTDVWIQIGGFVTKSGTPSTPVAGAWVRLERLSGEAVQTTETDEKGRFLFGELQPGRYQLRVRATGLGELTPVPQIEVPSTTGHYDLQFV